MTPARSRLRETFLPYCLPLIGEEEVNEVVDSLRSGWITTGPKVKRFEEAFALYVGAKHAIALNSCTAGLHISLAVLGIGPGDEVIVPTITFCATANVVCHLGATPVIVDVTEDLLIDPEGIRSAITPRTKAIIPVHYAGQSCDLDAIHAVAAEYGIPVIEDAAHAVGSEYKGRKIGTHSRSVVFSFYATKNLATGEGGMITTDDDEFAGKARLLSLHGMSRDAWKRYSQSGSWYYEVLQAGYKDNMTDLQASLGIHQLSKLDRFTQRRLEIASRYDQAFANLRGVVLPRRLENRNHVFHLYPIQLTPGVAAIGRDAFIDELRNANIGTSVHFIPLHHHPLYRDTYGYDGKAFPIADRAFSGLVSLPLYPKMTDDDVDSVILNVRHLLV